MSAWRKIRRIFDLTRRPIHGPVVSTPAPSISNKGPDHVQEGLIPPRANNRILVERFFFPAAAIHGALAVPLAVHAMLGGAWRIPGLATPAGHAHELFFGYALAVVTGFLINRLTVPRLIFLAGLWLAARFTFLALPGNPFAIAANAGFAVTVALTAAPRFMKGAKKWRNRLTGPLVIAICVAALAFQMAGIAGRNGLQYGVLDQSLVLFALLMVFFGGRIIAPAAAGAIEKAGGHLKARVQPRVEGALLLLLIGAVLLGLHPAMVPASGILLAMAGGLVIIRLARWRLWKCRARPDLVGLGIGYGWIAAGLVAIGTSRLFPDVIATAVAAHVLTVGAIGTLTANVMLRTRLLHTRRFTGSVPAFAWITGLMALATLLRTVGHGHPGWVTAASLAWSAALLLLFMTLMRNRERAARPGSRDRSTTGSLSDTR